jgi:hypothetical protein
VPSLDVTAGIDSAAASLFVERARTVASRFTAAEVDEAAGGQAAQVGVRLHRHARLRHGQHLEVALVRHPVRRHHQPRDLFKSLQVTQSSRRAGTFIMQLAVVCVPIVSACRTPPRPQRPALYRSPCLSRLADQYLALQPIGVAEKNTVRRAEVVDCAVAGVLIHQSRTNDVEGIR